MIERLRPLDGWLEGLLMDDAFEDDAGDPRATWTDFDCPDCNANNPIDDGFGDGDQIRCFYCGSGFDVKVDGEGRRRLRPE